MLGLNKWVNKLNSSVQFSCSVVSNSLQPHGLQHARPCSPPPTPGVYSNSCPLSRWCHPTISSSVITFSSCLQPSQHQGLFYESVLCIRWPKYWSFSFSISPSNEYSGLISFRMDSLDLLAVQESSPIPEFKSIHSSALNFLYGPNFTTIRDYWKNHSSDYTHFGCKVMSLLFNMLSRFGIAFLPRSKHLLISWLQSLSAVILEPKKIICHCFHCFSIYLHEVMGLDAMILVFWMLSFKPAFSHSSFTLVNFFLF